MTIEMKKSYRVKLSEQEYNALKEASNIVDNVYKEAKKYLSEDDIDMFYMIQGSFEVFFEWSNEPHQVEEEERE